MFILYNNDTNYNKTIDIKFSGAHEASPE